MLYCKNAVQQARPFTLDPRVLYRGLLQESLRRHRVLMGGSPWGSIIIASIFFTLMHIGAADWPGLPSLFVLSLGLGWVFTRTGRLVAPITVHILFNGFNLLLAAAVF